MKNVKTEKCGHNNYFIILIIVKLKFILFEMVNKTTYETGKNILKILY